MTSAPAPSRRAVVVADDLTGANDTGVRFAEAGWSTVLRLGPAAAPPGDRPGAWALSTDARPLPHDDAAGRTHQALDGLRLTPDDVVYLKVDSTLRGSVPGQLAGALTAWRVHHPDAMIVLCPAYPAMGRTVEDGIVLVHGTPVSRTPAGTDPVTPVTADAVAAIVPGAVAVPARATAEDWAAALADAAGRSTTGVVTTDARTDEDLARLAGAVLLLGPRALVAGSAGLAGPLARQWLSGQTPGPTAPAPPDVRRPLVMVSSQHDVARRQVAALEADDPDVTVLRPTLESLLDRSAETPPVPGTGPVVLLSPDRRAEPGASGALAHGLAALAVRLLGDGTRFDGLVLVGGDGAEALLVALAAQGVALHGALLEGVPVGVVSGGAADGLPVVTKAGGFGDDSTLQTTLRTLRTRTETESPR